MHKHDNTTEEVFEELDEAAVTEILAKFPCIMGFKIRFSSAAARD